MQIAQIFHDRGQNHGMLLLDRQDHPDQAQRRLVIFVAIFRDSAIGMDGEAFRQKIAGQRR